MPSVAASVRRSKDEWSRKCCRKKTT
jgi:hypothetical protein